MHHCTSHSKLVGSGVAAAEVCGFDQSSVDEGRQANALAYASISRPRALGKLSIVTMLWSLIKGWVWPVCSTGDLRDPFVAPDTLPSTFGQPDTAQVTQR